MPIIGKFKSTKEGGWEGRIRTLTVDLRAKFVPNDNRRSANSPEFIVTALGCQIGVAWKRARIASGKMALSVKLDDPFLSAPISAVLFSNDDDRIAELTWKRNGDNCE